MNLVINYDLLYKIYDINGKSLPLKTYRRYKKPLFTISPLFQFLFNHLVFRNPLGVALFGSTVIGIPMVWMLLSIYHLFDNDFSAIAKPQLQRLVGYLRALNVNTDYDLLLESEMYAKKYTFHFNEKKLPEILERKYILVPTYTYNGEIKDTSLVQEHVIGSRQYVLSLGFSSKIKSTAPARM